MENDDAGCRSPRARHDSTLTVVVHLPQPVDAVSRLLNVLADIWPNAKLDTTGAWRIEIPHGE